MFGIIKAAQKMLLCVAMVAGQPEESIKN